MIHKKHIRFTSAEIVEALGDFAKIYTPDNDNTIHDISIRFDDNGADMTYHEGKKPCVQPTPGGANALREPG